MERCCAFYQQRVQLCGAKNHYPEPNQHRLDFLHPILLCRITYGAPLEMLYAGIRYLLFSFFFPSKEYWWLRCPWNALRNLLECSTCMEWLCLTIPPRNVLSLHDDWLLVVQKEIEMRISSSKSSRIDHYCLSFRSWPIERTPFTSEKGRILPCTRFTLIVAWTIHWAFVGLPSIMLYGCLDVNCTSIPIQFLQ